MTTAPKVLAFDTSGPFVAIGTAHQDQATGQHENMARGQAETLMPMLEAALAARQWRWSDLDAIGVGVGPGNFTGIRIAVSAARGLALGLDIPAFSLTAFDCAHGLISPAPWTLVSLSAPREMAYVQVFGEDRSPMLETGQLIDPKAPSTQLSMHKDLTVTGHCANDIAAGLGLDPSRVRILDEDGETYAARMARITASRYLAMSERPAPPAPHYIKPPDAAPARDAAPAILP